eukprot:scaffold26285_cov71-Isochrysis_galbana.AAC.1
MEDGEAWPYNNVLGHGDKSRERPPPTASPEPHLLGRKANGCRQGAAPASNGFECRWSWEVQMNSAAHMGKGGKATKRGRLERVCVGGEGERAKKKHAPAPVGLKAGGTAASGRRSPGACWGRLTSITSPCKLRQGDGASGARPPEIAPASPAPEISPARPAPEIGRARRQRSARSNTTTSFHGPCTTARAYPTSTNRLRSANGLRSANRPRSANRSRSGAASAASCTTPVAVAPSPPAAPSPFPPIPAEPPPPVPSSSGSRLSPWPPEPSAPAAAASVGSTSSNETRSCNQQPPCRSKAAPGEENSPPPAGEENGPTPPEEENSPSPSGSEEGWCGLPNFSARVRHPHCAPGVETKPARSAAGWMKPPAFPAAHGATPPGQRMMSGTRTPAS